MGRRRTARRLPTQRPGAHAERRIPDHTAEDVQMTSEHGAVDLMELGRAGLPGQW